MPMDDDAHECVFGPFEESRMAGTVHRKCQHPGCRVISLDGDDDEEESDGDEMMEPSPDRPNHCPGCERYVSDADWVSYYDHCQACCDDPDIEVEGVLDEDDEDDDE